MFRITKYINAIHWSSIAGRCQTFEEYDILGHQVSYLIAIYKYPGLSQENLRDAMFVNKSTVARNVKTLIDKGYAKSEVDSEDKRVNRIYPTQKLIDFFPKIEKYLDEWNNEILSDLSYEEKVTFENLLKKVALKAVNITKEKRDAQ
ncbi:MarR family winged helix-turn-helix transcriptional regulator [Helcococcus kunzii]|uniref:MarR family winged helix-turn-helix transcriptional regulator n=1 Tax=Helcococcus kunzii TaxID=40091 RepID=UPI0021A75E7B|nr:MarR family winged helix-turn-helix transcriptional regulator [Helcococcus kunzii]MCT1796690.1 MarR family winged helix-turn-helix transcriptional regulator [Helcococcus kunzii]MCT1989094.1 MarR family winged helix-turn-helix transcriptional regulator [Helcococcus kunzii]